MIIIDELLIPSIDAKITKMLKLLLTIGGVFLLFLTMCTSKDGSEKTQKNSNSPSLQKEKTWKDAELDIFALRLSSKYKRAIDKNNCSVYFIPKSPNTIVIQVRQYPDYSRTKLKEIVRSAEELVKGLAKDEYGIENVNIETDWKEVSRPSPL